MPARTTRQEARDRALKAFTASLDKIIPPEGAGPLKGSTFRDWEDQVEALIEQTAPTVLEERAALEDSTQVEWGDAGRCPQCSSGRVYLEAVETTSEVIRPHGKVVAPSSTAAAAPAAALFPRSRAAAGSARSQDRDWSLPAEVPLTPRAAERLARESASHGFDLSARALERDWGMALHPEQVRRASILRRTHRPLLCFPVRLLAS